MEHSLPQPGPNEASFATPGLAKTMSIGRWCRSDLDRLYDAVTKLGKNVTAVQGDVALRGSKSNARLPSRNHHDFSCKHL
jgi:hypothetical protein